METELLSLGIASKHSRPYHPQTCGKVERFHQTLKKYLAKRNPPTTKKQLQAQLDRFVAYYNNVRPHRAARPAHTSRGVRRPREGPSPTDPGSTALGYRVRHDKVDKSGNVTLRYHGRLHHIGVGNAYKGWRGHPARRRPRDPHPHPRRHAAPPAEPRPDEGLPADALTDG